MAGFAVSHFPVRALPAPTPGSSRTARSVFFTAMKLSQLNHAGRFPHAAESARPRCRVTQVWSRAAQALCNRRIIDGNHVFWNPDCMHSEACAAMPQRMHSHDRHALQELSPMRGGCIFNPTRRRNSLPHSFVLCEIARWGFPSLNPPAARVARHTRRRP